jgi:adenosine kinase
MGCGDSRAVAEGALLGVGNPLLDISSPTDLALVEKYGLKMGNAILADEKVHMPLYDELAKKDTVEYIAGGATQNSIRVAQWMLQVKGATTYVGCVGKDAVADQLKTCAEADGVTTNYLVDEKTSTGKCACLINNKERSLVAFLGAANNYKKEHMVETKSYEAAKVIYIAGFFTTVSPDTIQFLAEHALEKGKTFMMNLSAPFIMMVPPFQKALKDAFPYVNFLFGNESEAKQLDIMMGWNLDGDVAKIALKAAAMPTKGEVARTVVFTQGSEYTIVASEGVATCYEVPALESKEIVDTNGAGDAFVGGFLAAHLRAQTNDIAVDAGHYSAQTIIKTSGTSLSGKPDYKPNGAKVLKVVKAE